MLPKHYLAFLFLLCGGQSVVAEEVLPAEDSAGLATEQSAISDATGMLMLDYAKIPLAGGGTFDLLGAHYLHQFNDWLYWGGGLSAPMLEGDYGGFFAVDVNLHAQQKVFGNWFVDAGLAVGAGAGGSSVANIKDLSGSGAYFKTYAGFGYDAGALNIGVNYAKIKIPDSPIDTSTINVFLQKPLSYSVGSYSDAGTRLGAMDSNYRDYESIISFEYNTLSQINPTGKYVGDIGLVSPQFSQFFSDDDYFFFGLDLGLSGLIWYNQAQGGYGRRFSLTPNINLYGQIGIGSGGWVTDAFDTGPGLVVYPKVKAEYLFSTGVGASLSAGYLFAPKGSSKNWSFGAGINYHLLDGDKGVSENNAAYDSALRGVRVNLFERKLFDVVSNGENLDDLDLTALQLDYAFTDNWYVSGQIAAATSHFKGYAGYVEGLVGFGWQSDLVASDKLQGFAQVLYGMNDIGIDARYDVGALLNPSIGFNYSLNDQYAIYGQVGKTVSLDQYLKPNSGNYFENVSVGLGLTYRFSTPTRVSR